MHRVLAHRPSPAMVVALLALFVSLGGSAFAALNLPKNSVGTRQLKNGSVTGAKLHKNSVNSSKVKDHSLLARDFKAGQLPAGPQGPQGLAGPQGPPGPATGPAGGALAGSYPNPTLNVSGGDNGAAACKAGEALIGVSPLAALTCAGVSPSGAAGGDLTGFYPDPSIANGKVTNAQLANPALMISPGTGLMGGGSIPLGGSDSLSVADGGIGTTQLADGSITTAKFAAGAQAPDAAELNTLPASDYGAVLSGRVDGLSTTGLLDFGAASGISTASGTENAVSTLSPGENMVAQDLSVQLTAAPGTGFQRQFYLDVNGALTITCVVAGSATTCSAGGTASVPAGSTLSLAAVPTSSAAAADARFAFTLTPS